MPDNFVNYMLLILQSMFYGQKIKAKDVSPKLLNGLTKHFPNWKKKAEDL
ncbi:MAG: hypothetical protein IPM04_08950 [Saprospiraceae bacterium]|nr:hypothetical protein [Candidatus Brachybacter algidus]MBK8747985.1 hypothetical protein [Candidatus Brachybacter algidus]